MASKNKIIDLKNVKILDNKGVPILKNVSLSFYEGQNTAISARNRVELEACKRLIAVLAGDKRADYGDVTYARFNDLRKYIFGYNNFNNILIKDVKPEAVLNALYTKEDITDKNRSEIKAIIHFLSLEEHLQKTMPQLDINTRYLFNLIFLLIIKPRILFLKTLALPQATSSVQSAILKLIRDYTDKHNITLIISSNDPLVCSELCDRFIEVENQVVVRDKERQQNFYTNKVDNVTKAFNLDDELSASLESFNKNNSKTFGGNNTFGPSKSNKTSAINKNFSNNGNEIASTKALSDAFDHIISNKEDTARFVPVAKTSAVHQKTNRNINFKKLDTSLLTNEQEKMSKSEAKIHHKTQELRLDAENLIEDIKLNQQNKQPRDGGSNLVERISTENEINNEIIKDLIDTYYIRKQLEQQIKSPDFVQLSVELQNKVFDNYERANNLIKENDPKGLYDPTKTSKLKIVDNKDSERDIPENQGFTRMILSEELGLLDEEIKDERLENIYKSKTSEFDIDDIDDELSSKQSMDKTLSMVLDSVPTDELYQDEPQRTKRREAKTLDYGYHDNNNKKENFFKKHFQKGNKTEKTQTSKTHAVPYYTKPMYDLDDEDVESYEPSSTKTFNKTTKQEESKTKATTKHFEPAKEEPKFKPPLKTKAIKTRSKKNKIEELFEEALADEELIQDLKEQEE